MNLRPLFTKTAGLGYGLLAWTLALPVRAQDTPEDFEDLADLLIGIFNLLIQLLTAVALAVFLWGLAQYVFKADEDPAIAKGKFLMTWGILALFVLVSVWGILQLIYGDLFSVPFGTFLLPES